MAREPNTDVNLISFLLELVLELLQQYLVLQLRAGLGLCLGLHQDVWRLPPWIYRWRISLQTSGKLDWSFL